MGRHLQGPTVEGACPRSSTNWVLQYTVRVLHFVRMELPSAVPVMTLPNVILFPQAMLPLHIFEPRYRRMLADVLASHRLFALAMQKHGHHRESPVAIAGLGLVRACVTNRDGTSNLVLQGLCRVRLGRALRYKPYRVHGIQPLTSARSHTSDIGALTAKLLNLVTERLELGFQLPSHLVQQLVPFDEKRAQDPTVTLPFKEIIKNLARLNDPEQLADLVSCTLLPAPEERQAILEAVDLENRLRCLICFLTLEIRRHRHNKTYE